MLRDLLHLKPALVLVREVAAWHFQKVSAEKY